MIAAVALELLLLGLAVWQLIVLRRGMKADREKQHADQRNRTEEA